MNVWCYGSNVKGDDLAWKVGRELGFKVTSNIHDVQDGDVVVDVVHGLDKVRDVKLDELKSNKSVSVHDFDLGTYLRLMKGILNVRVIGIPEKMLVDDAVRGVKELLKKK